MCRLQQQKLGIEELPQDSYSEPRYPYTLFEDDEAHNNRRRLNPPTDDVYNALARAKQFEPATTSLPMGAKAHWIGSDSAEKILIFFHGKHSLDVQAWNLDE